MSITAKKSVNFYMFFGGTNFGFTAGANNEGIGRYQVNIITSENRTDFAEFEF